MGSDGEIHHVSALGKLAKGYAEKATGRPSNKSPQKVKNILLKTIQEGHTNFATFYAVPKKSSSALTSLRSSPTPG
jgi:hypothetical protein